MRSRGSAALSDLERELERGWRDYETPLLGPAHFSLPWVDAQVKPIVDAQGKQLITEFYVDQDKKTATIIVPPYVDTKGKSQPAATYNFIEVTKNAGGTKIRGRTQKNMLWWGVTFTIVVESVNSRVENSRDPENPTKVAPENAQKMIDFVKTLNVPSVEGEIGMYEIDEELPDEMEFEDSADDEEFELEDDDREMDEDDSELESMGEAGDEDDQAMEQYAQNLYEISQREFESESDLDRELDSAIDQVEAEYFVERVKRRRKRGKGKGIFGNILKAGARIVGKVASKLPIGSLVKAGTSLVRGDLKGVVKNLGKAAIGTLGTAVLGPAGGALATSALDALAPDKEVGPRRRRRMAIRRVARITRDAYRELADNLPEQMDHPYVAHEAVTQAVRKAMVKNRLGPQAARAAAHPKLAATHPRLAAARVVRLNPGETVVIKA